ncbi:DUF3048 domain-containing protein [Streptomyces sp. Rer75]|uniref:DUF3048 domain-containing protein n=1 Tax=Streptomyces sp. Rer75 TaxID=2750011 RepID=UPI0015D09CD0|nr:DUF3048 domain-containing protein [Streptomyces sp. Rer75]QLH19823.1 DUF3048 domain-containing protein [Streptomyces sp. Rer75]
MSAERVRPGPPGARPATLLLTALIALALLGGCQGQDGGRARPTEHPRPTEHARSPVTGQFPFTGVSAKPAPVLAVKIDNASQARPQTGLGAADIVYVEQVEGGLSRMLAVFSSRLPAEVGPVRSARESDLDLLHQFGRPALAYSGVQSRLRSTVEAAPLYPLPPATAPRAYVRGTEHPAPHNLYVRPEAALRLAPHASDASDIGFRFGAAPPGGEPRKGQTVRYPSAGFTFTWSAAAKRWLVAMDGTPARTTDGGRLGAATVVVQHTTVRPSRFHDVLGSVTPFTETVGSGGALVLRDGKAYESRWSRPGAGGGTAFTTADGDRMTFAPGPVWVVFTAR